MENRPDNRLRVLIVEDDHITARDLENALERRGFPVTAIVPNVAEASQVMERERPDILLLDIQLSGESEGIEFARRAKEKWNLPVIFITGYSEDTVFDRARELRPAGFVRKPFSDAELVACLEAAAERRLSRERLETKLPGLEAAASQLSQPVLAADLDGNIVYANEASSRYLKCDPTEAEGAALADVFRMEDVEESTEEKDLVASDGTRRRVVERTAPIKTNDGEMIGLVHVFDPGELVAGKPGPLSDGPMPAARVSALKKVAELARDPAFRELIGERSKSEFPHKPEESIPEKPTLQSVAPLVEELGDPLISISSDGKIIYANKEAQQVFGDGDSIADRDFWSLFGSEEFRDYDKDFNRPLADQRRHRFEFKDRERALWFEVRVYPSRDGILGLFHDITSSKLQAAEMVRQQRLEGLGLLARGFAHDFNNHLTTLTGNLSLARERHVEDGELQQMLAEAQGAANRAAGLVQQLMTFAQGGQPICENVRVTDLVRGILAEHREKNPQIRYQFQGSEAELRAFVDPAQVSRLVENLVSNAEEAMPEGGVLIVRCARILSDEVRNIRRDVGLLQEDYLLIEVIDTGEGISEETLNHVFEPYYTTRKKNNATGIGLTVCESIAKAHGGFVHLQSKEGKGTIASFCVPFGKPDRLWQSRKVAEMVVSPPVPTQVEGEESVSPARILILEDDAPIRRLMSATLKREGHRVVETAEGRSTIVEYQRSIQEGRKFQLVICDLTIEDGLGGIETIKHLQEIDPEVVAMVSSGYSDAPAMSDPTGYGFKAVLPKPYAPSQLSETVKQVLSMYPTGA